MGRGNGSVVPITEISRDMYRRLTQEHLLFWSEAYEPYMRRDIARPDMKGLIRMGLEQTNGNYRSVVPLFNMENRDYKRFLNFLRKHDCQVPFMEYRNHHRTSNDVSRLVDSVEHIS